MSSSSGTFTTDLSLVVRSWDAWLAEATGIPEADACGRPIAELFPELAARGHLARLERVAATGAVEVLAPAFHQYLLPMAPRVPSAHFARMQQHVSIAPLRAGEAMVGVAVTIEDVTARRDRERQLAARLASADEGERLAAVRTLDAEGMQGGRAGFAVEPLAGALGDSSWRVRRAAAETLGSIDDEGAADALLAAVRDRHRDPAVLNAAITALGYAANTNAARDVVPPLVELVAGDDADVRTYAALALGLLEDARAVPVLVTAMQHDPDANVRYHAIEALGRIGSRAAAAAVARVAESRDFAVAFAALDTLALIGEPSVASRIVPLLDDDLLCPAAADALGRLGGEEVARPLAAALARPGAPVAALALALARLHERMAAGEGDGSFVVARTRHETDRGRGASAATVDMLVAELEVASDEERRGIVTVLGWLAGDAVVPALARALEWPATRRQAAELLAQRGGAAVEPLLAALAAAGEDDDVLRKAIASALGRIGAPSAIPALVALLDGPPDVAVCAAGALGGIGGRDAFEPLLAHLEHPQAAVRQAVVASLCSLGHPAMSERLRELLAAASPRLREAGVKIAGYFADPASLEAVLALAERDEDEGVRRAAVEQLALFEDLRAAPSIARALREGAPGVRAAAARALTHVDAAIAAPALLDACRDPDPWVRYYSARSAGHARRAEAAPTLTTLALHDPVPPVRIAAIEALVEIGAAAGSAALEALVPLAGDRDPGIRRPALAALARPEEPRAIALLLEALRGDDRECRLAALDVLARRADAAAAPVVAAVATQAADDGADASVRARAVDALAQLARGGSEDAVTALVALAGRPRHTAAAVAALAGLDEAQAPSIARGLGHADAGVRCAVIEALARMRAAPAVVSRLVAPALGDDTDVVRLAAAEALGRLDLRAADGDLRDHASGAGA